MFVKLQTYYKLGASNLVRVGLYRLGLKTGLHPVLKISGDVIDGPFFDGVGFQAPKGAKARKEWQAGKAYFFGKEITQKNKIPNWFENPLKPNIFAESKKPWWQISDFDSDVGDIKTVWEASRFDWLIPMAQRAALGDVKELNRLNLWLADWVKNNPPYKGVNWKCGQEASIRLLHLAMVAQILGQVYSSNSQLQALVKLHLKRIAPTMGYAIGQSNNHGTSEAAALFVGGSWLETLGDNDGAKWAKTGRKWLEERSQALIEADGSFSQYSVTYHRMMLDTYSFAKFWQGMNNLQPFTQNLSERLKSALYWLVQMSDEKSGDAPNIGANDGVHILNLAGADYRDFRPSIQLAAKLFLDCYCYDKSDIYDQPLIWLGLDKPKEVISKKSSCTFDNGGYHVLRNKRAVVYMRYPKFKFRPSQADALHCDLWVDGENLLRDAGSYSYNSSVEDTVYFSGTRSHNTIEFDDKDQMPRLSRFLFGSWLSTNAVELFDENEGGVSAIASYSITNGAMHQRSLLLKNTNHLECIDRIDGSFEKAVLRWRLAKGNWKLKDNVLSSGNVSISVSSDTPFDRIEVAKGCVSLYYLEKSDIDVFEIEISKAAQIKTVVVF